VIEGIVTRDGIPQVSLNVAGRTWLATVDTGFNGALELPSGSARYCNTVSQASPGPFSPPVR
jgi:hypothetical protein